MKSIVNTFLPLLIITMAIFAGCKEDQPDDKEPSGKIIFHFNHFCEGDTIELDQTIYTNEAGNEYQINEIKYFISDITLHKADGKKVVINKENDIYYVDAHYPATLKWQVYDPIPVGEYEKVTFTFGLNETKNQSFMYVNPPEVEMVWPEILGGGYHYMMINGKYWDAPYLRPFDFHLGIGQIYPPNSHNYDSIQAFVHNHFEVELPNSSFTIAEGKTINFDIIMQIDEWFKNPHIWDHEFWGNYTMENQDAMQTMKENGASVFITGNIR